ncbi:MAG: oxidoreductase, partial [Myxococcales bacterium]|nr:oxidoreductase [Myxococcales bacterium]
KDGSQIPVGQIPQPEKQGRRLNMKRRDYFDAQFRAGLGYHQPSTPFSAVGLVPAATGASASKYVARRETPIFIAENCTQCMNCIAACPDTALPNSAQDVDTMIGTAFENYVTDAKERSLLVDALPTIESNVREAMLANVKAKTATPFTSLVCGAMSQIEGVSETARGQVQEILSNVPVAYNKVNAIFAGPEKKKPGSGGVFSITVSDRCKGCGECVTECGDHDALRMVPDSEEVNAGVATATAFLELLPTTSPQHLGKYVSGDPLGSRQATLRNHLMEMCNYEALVSGDGACAGCGEKSVLRSIATVTEAYMRPLYHAKAERLEAMASELEQHGSSRLSALAKSDDEAHRLFVLAVAHVVMGLGGEDEKDTRARIEQSEALSDDAIVDALVAVMRQDAFNHHDLQAIDGGLTNGMSVMAMGASTGCNSVYGSTPPNNPHPYPWMNSLFQDGTTITWMFGESFIVDHARRSVIPEILATSLLTRESSVMTEAEFFDLTHFSDALMTDLQIDELPKAWYVGGDGATGDIGFQNTSKVVLQNRPNVKMLLLDTQVYSNTGGQNSDSTPLLGGSDMNQIGAATQGKLTEKKSVAEIFTVGHGSPFVAQVSMADAPKLYRTILEGLAYRGTAFLQCFTTCQPEHGVGDSMSTVQARRVRDSRGMPEFVFDPGGGEIYADTMNLKGNPQPARDWAELKAGKTGPKYRYTTAHWAATEARFRRHLKPTTAEKAKDMIHLDDMLVCLTQDDVVRRRFHKEGTLAYVPDYGVYIEIEGPNGELEPRSLSRQLVLFCVERRKSWRLLQSRSGVVNKDYQAQRSLLAKAEKGEVTMAELRSSGWEMLEVEKKALV